MPCGLPQAAVVVGFSLNAGPDDDGSGRPQGNSDLQKERVPVQELAHRVRDLLRDEPDTKLDNPRLSELAREVFGTAVGNARDAYDAAEGSAVLWAEPSPRERTAQEQRQPAQTLTCTVTPSLSLS